MTPSKRRQQGREAFDPNTDPADVIPYNKDQWGYDIYVEDFLDGWTESQEHYNQQLEREEKEKEVENEPQ